MIPGLRDGPSPTPKRTGSHSARPRRPARQAGTGGRGAGRRHPPAPRRALAWAPEMRPDAGPLAGPQWPGRDPRAWAGRPGAAGMARAGPGQAGIRGSLGRPRHPRAWRGSPDRPGSAGLGRPDGRCGNGSSGSRRTGLIGSSGHPAGRGAAAAASAYGATLGGRAAIQPAPSGVAGPVSASLTARSAPFRAGPRPATRPPRQAPGAPRPARRPAHRSLSVTQVRSRSPMYSLSGRISRLSACCSMTWAVHPAIRLTENTGVNSSVGMPR